MEHPVSFQIKATDLIEANFLIIAIYNQLGIQLQRAFMI